MLSLDEAIKHCEEVAESKQRQVDEEAWEKGSLTEKKCLECATEHRQLAEWLRELQSIREIVRDTEIGFDNATDHVEREEVISDGYFRVEKVIHEDKGYIEWLEGSESE